MLALIDRIEAGEMRVDELIDGFIDPDALEEEAARSAEPSDEETLLADEDDDGRRRRRRSRRCDQQRQSGRTQGANLLEHFGVVKAQYVRDAQRRWKKRQPEQDIS